MFLKRNFDCICFFAFFNNQKKFEGYFKGRNFRGEKVCHFYDFWTNSLKFYPQKMFWTYLEISDTIVCFKKTEIKFV